MGFPNACDVPGVVVYMDCRKCGKPAGSIQQFFNINPMEAKNYDVEMAIKDKVVGVINIEMEIDQNTMTCAHCGTQHHICLDIMVEENDEDDDDMGDYNDDGCDGDCDNCSDPCDEDHGY